VKTVLETIQGGTEYFEKRGVESARLNMEHLIASVLGCERMQLYLDFDRPMEEGELEPLRDLVKRRAGGEPLQHLLGTVEFFGREFGCDSRALVPRPETEELVARVLERCAREEARVLDMGTGSGVIGLTLAGERAGWELVLADVSAEALGLAAENREKLGLGGEARISLAESDLLGGVAGEFDVIVANLPYVPEGDESELSREVLRDPARALYGGATGTELMARFVLEAVERLRAGGLLAMEMGLGQGEELANYFKNAGLGDVVIESDLTKRERFVFGIKN
jgi:release factor glutamine methyltransferase